MMTISRIASASLLAVTVALVGCGGSTAADASPQTAQSAITTAPVGAQTHGVVKVVGDALGQVPLRAEQRTELEQIATDAEARHQSVASVRQDLVNAVAAQVESGKLDRAALQPKIDAAAASWEKIRAADRAALERVHAILDGTQRAQFADALHATMKAKHGEHEHAGHPGMKEWAKDLNLTDAQRDQIKAAFKAKMKEGGHDMHADFKEHKARAEKVFEAFKSDHFVLDEVAPKVDAKAAANKMSDRVLGMAETILPILTPEQRTAAAQKIRAHASGDSPVMQAPSPF